MLWSERAGRFRFDPSRHLDSLLGRHRMTSFRATDTSDNLARGGIGQRYRRVREKADRDRFLNRHDLGSLACAENIVNVINHPNIMRTISLIVWPGVRRFKRPEDTSRKSKLIHHINNHGALTYRQFCDHRLPWIEIHVQARALSECY
jgi:hypothetical protein